MPTLSICLRCLIANHTRPNCTKPTVQCQYCGADHHSSLCFHPNAPGSDKRNALSEGAKNLIRRESLQSPAAASTTPQQAPPQMPPGFYSAHMGHLPPPGAYSTMGQHAYGQFPQYPQHHAPQLPPQHMYSPPPNHFPNANATYAEPQVQTQPGVGGYQHVGPHPNGFVTMINPSGHTTMVVEDPAIARLQNTHQSRIRPSSAYGGLPSAMRARCWLPPICHPICTRSPSKLRRGF